MVRIREAKQASPQLSRATPQPKFGAEMQSATSGPQIKYVREEMARSAGGKAGPEQSEPSPVPAAGTEPVAIPHAVVLEQIAHNFAYQSSLAPKDEAWLATQGYQPPSYYNGAYSMTMASFRPLEGSGQPAVLAFRGTLAEGEDVIDDGHPEGPGTYQFQANEGAIVEELVALSVFGRVEVTGHSLGGALAQMAAVSSPDLVARVETFQSPGISYDRAESLRSRNRNAKAKGKPEVLSTHHRVDSDYVSEAGQDFTPGTVKTYDAPALNPMDAHGTFPAARTWAGGDPAKKGAVPQLGAELDLKAAQDSRPNQSNVWKEATRQTIGTMFLTTDNLSNQAYGIHWEHAKKQYLDKVPLEEIVSGVRGSLTLSKEQEQRIIDNLDAFARAQQALDARQQAIGEAGPGSPANLGTRAGFVGSLLRAIGKSPPGRDPARVVAQAKAEGLLSDTTNPERPILRAEAAAILGKAAGWDTSAPSGEEVAWFTDVRSSDWFFAAAHRARLHGVFAGTTRNRFNGKEALSHEHAALVLGRFGNGGAAAFPKAKQVEHLEPDVKVPSAPVTKPVLAYPGVGGPLQEKHEFYTAFVEEAGFSGSLATANGSFNLIGIRGLNTSTLAEMRYGQTAGKYDDVFVVLGKDNDGNLVVKEYPGSTDPGKYKDVKAQNAGFGGAPGENWAVKEGVYEYQHAGKYKFGSEKFAMTVEQTSKRGVDLYVDKDGDDNFHGEKDTVENEKNNANFLIHKGGPDPTREVSTWSSGCQVIAGKNENGQDNMDEAAALLRQNPGAKFNYLLIDGKRVAERMA